MTEVVADNLVVLFNYTLTDADGEEIDASDGDPMPYLHGFENIVPGLEEAMTGRAVGDAFTVVVAPEDGYGEYNEEGAMRIARSEYPDDDLEIGMVVVLESDNGDAHHCWVTDITEDDFEIDMNHPLAGEELHFAIEIVGIRAATAEELDHGHPHGVDGTDAHHH